jgi:PAS domain S-box-containing protein
MIKDITDMKETNSKYLSDKILQGLDLEEQKSITRGILDASFDALFVINNQGIIQEVNETSTAVFGWKREEFIGRNIHMIMTSDVAASHNQYLQNYLQTGIKKMIGTQREVTAQRKDKSTFPCVLGLSQARDSGLFCGFIRDLTSEKAAQSEIVQGQNITLGILDACKYF